MIKETVLCLDDEYEYYYALKLCKELDINFEVLRWHSKNSAHVTRKEPSSLENFKMETVFSADESNLGFFMHLLTIRMDRVNLFNRCLDSGKEEINRGRIGTSLDCDKDLDDFYDMLYNEH